jgi:hypothetical protein
VVDRMSHAGSKISPVSCGIELNGRRLDPIAEASELPNHSRSACSLRVSRSQLGDHFQPKYRMPCASKGDLRQDWFLDFVCELSQ